MKKKKKAEKEEEEEEVKRKKRIKSINLGRGHTEAWRELERE